MNIKNKFTENKKLQILNESVTPQKVNKPTIVKENSLSEQSQVNTQKLQTVLTTKSKQFVFDCGAIMGNIKYDTGNAFSLKYHADNSINFESFIESIKNIIEATGEKLTQNDINRLKKAYESR